MLKYLVPETDGEWNAALFGASFWQILKHNLPIKLHNVGRMHRWKVLVPETKLEHVPSVLVHISSSVSPLTYLSITPNCHVKMFKISINHRHKQCKVTHGGKNVQRVYCDPKSEWIRLGKQQQSTDLPGCTYTWLGLSDGLALSLALLCSCVSCHH